MAEYIVTHVRLDPNDGTVAMVRGPALRPTDKAAVVLSIEVFKDTYYAVSGAWKAKIIVVMGRNAPYLRTEPDLTKKDNLLNLPQF